MPTGDVLDAKIIEIVKGGVIGLCGGVRVFIPASQSGLPKDADLHQLQGQTKKVKIIDINEQRKRVVASIRVVEREEAKARKEAFWAQVEPGQQYHGEVKSLTSYGAFVDLGGVDGMVHTSELSWKRIKHPSEVVNVGDMIDVVVKDVDKEAKRFRSPTSPLTRIPGSSSPRNIRRAIPLMSRLCRSWTSARSPRLYRAPTV